MRPCRLVGPHAGFARPLLPRAAGPALTHGGYERSKSNDPKDDEEDEARPRDVSLVAPSAGDGQVELRREIPDRQAQRDAHHPQEHLATTSQHEDNDTLLVVGRRRRGNRWTATYCISAANRTHLGHTALRALTSRKPPFARSPRLRPADTLKVNLRPPRGRPCRRGSDAVDTSA